MAKQAYVYSGTDWVPLASEVTNLSNYYTKGEIDIITAPTGLKNVVPSSVAVGSGTGSVSALGTVTFTGASSVSINDVFSATYDNYLIQWNNCVAVTSDSWLSIRMRVSGSDDSSANYHSEQLRGASATASAFRSTGGTSWIENIYLHTAFADFGTLELSNPFATRITSGYSKNSADVNGSGIGVQVWSRGLNTTTSYTGFSFFPATGGSTMTGSVSVYGYNK